MDNSKTQNDDFKQLFDNSVMPDLPLDMEENVMLGIEIQQLRAKRTMPQWLNTQLILFCLSLFLVITLSVSKSLLRLELPLLSDFILLLFASMLIFGFLWVIQLAEKFLVKRYSSKTA